MLWFLVSGLIVAVSVVSLGTRGLNLGIDFRGGVQMTFKTQQFTPLSKVSAQTAAIGHSNDALVQGKGVSEGDAYKNFQIRLKHLSTAKQNELSNKLKANVGAFAPGIKNVSSSFGKQIARSAVIAVLFSLFVITLYIAVRFKGLAFAVPVIAALLHDLLITVGIYSLTGREVTEATVAAVLTVLGYSIYDTIIIFDRIRENIPIMRRASFATIVNVSLWETIRRSLATTFITLLPVGALFFFGGSTLKDFAFALMIGVASGAYSSIFIAAPILAWWKEREPEYARRHGDSYEATGSGLAPIVPERPDQPKEPTDLARQERRRARRATRRAT